MEVYPKCPTRDEEKDDEEMKVIVKQITMLKKISETLKGAKITENCYNEDEVSVSDPTTTDADDTLKKGKRSEAQKL